MKRPSVINREKVEESLPSAVRGSLYDIYRAWEIHETERWPDHPIVGDWLTLTAVQTLRDRMMRRGVLRTAALKSACHELGLNYETVRSRLKDTTKRYIDARSPQGGNSTKKLKNHR